MSKICMLCGKHEHEAKGLCRKCYMQQYYLNNIDSIKAKTQKRRRLDPEKYKAVSTRKNRQRGHVSMGDNKTCTMFLGVHIAERVLRNVFKNVEHMPYNNPGYDFICNKGKKIDVKSACLSYGPHQKPRWNFTIKKNKIPDYFLCLAFDNRENLNPMHIWLIPSCDVCHSTAAVVSIHTIDKWKKYALDVNKVSKCCDVMKGVHS